MKETNTISMMNFEDFKKVIMKKAEPVAGEGGTVDITHVIKNNGCEYDGLIILNRECDIANNIFSEGVLKKLADKLESDIVYIAFINP